MRVIVTGSRDWTGSARVRHGLDLALKSALVLRETLYVIHGLCPRGPDAFAHQWVAEAGDAPVSEEMFPADWNRYGRRAGPIRNQEMVAAGADLCLAFIGPCTALRCPTPGPHGSHGATGCADLARVAGIETIRTETW